MELSRMRLRQGLYATGVRGESIVEENNSAAKKSRVCFYFVPPRVVPGKA